MYVMRLLHDAVFMKAGSYDTSPGPSGVTRICCRSVARIAPFSIGSSKRRSLRLSMTVRLSFAILPPPGGGELPVALQADRAPTRTQYDPRPRPPGQERGQPLVAVRPGAVTSARHAASRGASPARRGTPPAAPPGRAARCPRCRARMEAPFGAVPGDPRGPHGRPGARDG